MGLIVSDAGPLIALEKTGFITLLRKLFHTVYIPRAVWDELGISTGKPGSKELHKIIVIEQWIKVEKIEIPAHSSLPLLLDAGEAEAIFLAIKKNALLLIDEKKGRAIAQKYKLKIIGTGRILIAAKEKGFLPDVKFVLDKLNDAGYRFSKVLYDKIIKLAKE